MLSKIINIVFEELGYMCTTLNSLKAIDVIIRYAI